MSILEVNGLVKTFGRKRVVNGVSFSVEAGEIVGLLGPNGAGKTTTLAVLCACLADLSGMHILNRRLSTKYHKVIPELD